MTNYPLLKMPPLCIITTSFPMMTFLTMCFPMLLNEVNLMSNSHFLSRSSHVAAILWENSHCYCLLGWLLFLRLGCIKNAKKQKTSRFRLLLIRSLFSENMVHNITPTLYQTKCYKDISHDLYPTPRLQSDFLSPYQFLSPLNIIFKTSNFSCCGK